MYEITMMVALLGAPALASWGVGAIVRKCLAQNRRKHTLAAYAMTLTFVVAFYLCIVLFAKFGWFNSM